MQTIGMFQAKTHLPEVIRNVQKGATYTLTNRHQEVAIIMSIDEYHNRCGTTSESPYATLKSIFKTNPFGSADDIIEMRDEGRK